MTLSTRLLSNKNKNHDVINNEIYNRENFDDNSGSENEEIKSYSQKNEHSEKNNGDFVSILNEDILVEDQEYAEVS